MLSGRAGGSGGPGGQAARAARRAGGGTVAGRVGRRRARGWDRDGLGGGRDAGPGSAACSLLPVGGGRLQARTPGRAGGTAASQVRNASKRGGGTAAGREEGPCSRGGRGVGGVARVEPHAVVGSSVLPQLLRHHPLRGARSGEGRRG